MVGSTFGAVEGDVVGSTVVVEDGMVGSTVRVVEGDVVG